MLALEDAGVAPAAPTIDVFFVSDGAPRERVAGWLRELRERGVSCDTDYAGRSLKGQLTQAARLGASVTVVVRDDDATVRRSADGADEIVSLDDVIARIVG